MELDLERQEQLIERLLDPSAYDHPVDQVEHLETHISHVLLAGDYAYKIKKPLNLGFLDFSTLAKRRHFCNEELRLNRRLARELYLEVVPIVGGSELAHMGGDGEAVEYAVRMRRFPQEALLQRDKALDTELVERIAGELARFHRRVPSLGKDEPLGTPAAATSPIRENFLQIRSRLHDAQELARLDRIETWAEARCSALRPRLVERRDQGFIRECHGDMHLGNIALVDGALVIFDGIEFNPALRWIDTMSEVAFLVMDLEHAGHPRLARRFLDRYLEVSGDYAGLRLLPFYLVYRALVRAKVTAIRMGQADLKAGERDRVQAEYRSYGVLAEGFTVASRPAVILMHGVSGSGKSSLARQLVESLPAIRIRSDVERKRLFDLEASVRSGSQKGDGIYSARATEATYQRMLDLAGTITDACEAVVVDATFLLRQQRQDFCELAQARGLPFLILAADASETVLRERVERRLAELHDPSEATVEVLQAQLAQREPLTPGERAYSLQLDTTEAWSENDLLALVRERLAARE